MCTQSGWASHTHTRGPQARLQYPVCTVYCFHFHFFAGDDPFSTSFEGLSPNGGHSFCLFCLRNTPYQKPRRRFLYLYGAIMRSPTFYPRGAFVQTLTEMLTRAHTLSTRSSVSVECFRASHGVSLLLSGQQLFISPDRSRSNVSST